jgi:putative cardiolipin synthase
MQRRAWLDAPGASFDRLARKVKPRLETPRTLGHADSATEPMTANRPEGASAPFDRLARQAGRGRASLRWLLCAGLVVLGGCATLPPPADRVATTAVTETAGTRLGRALAPLIAANPGRTGILSMPDPRNAFAARALLAAAAEASIDAQYYVWHGDQVGDLLFQSLWEAAERGVRVRLLLDDLNTKGLDPTIAALDAHPNIEVRLYNPLLERDSRVLNFVGDFARANRRMHNKSFTVDNQATVVGGRNIGNEYFGGGDGLVFADLDVLAVGRAVSDVSKEFDLYWNSASAYPAATFVGHAPAAAASELEARFAANRTDTGSIAYLDAVRTTPLVRNLIERNVGFEWTTAEILHDDPAKTLDTSERTDVLLFPELVRKIGRPTQSLDVVSPYFVPGRTGTEQLATLARSGIAVRVLTNSLAASDVKLVHSGYAKRRRDLLEAGVRLFEIKPDALQQAASAQGKPSVGSSSGLHAKTLAVDRARIFVGSFNFDPRSARLNTEMGLVIESTAAATDLARFFDIKVPQLAYEVRLAAGGMGLEWVESSPSGDIRHETEPRTSWSTRMAVELLSVLPIEWLL